MEESKGMRTERTKRRPSVVGLILKEHRKQHGLTQEQAAHYLGIEPRTLRMYENGERSIENVRELRRIATLLGIDPQRFGLATVTIDSCTPEQIDEVVANTWGFLGQSRFSEARSIISTLLQDMDYYPFEDTELLRSLARAHHVAGHVTALTCRTTEVAQAIRHFQRMEDIARYIKDDTLLNIALTYHGDMERRRGSMQKAVTYLEAARDTTPQANQAACGDAAQLLGRIYLRMNNLDGFERSLGLAEEIAATLNLIGDKIMGAFNLGTVYEEYARGWMTLGQHQKAIYYIEKAKNTLPNSKRWELVLEATKAETLVRGDDLHEGIKLAVSVAQCARTLGHNRLLERIYRLHNYLDRKVFEIGQANMLLREALIGPFEAQC
jgi:transcriptional regulator with XRE-family HTH domain